MKTVKVACDVSGLRVNSVKPSFKYTFEEVGEPIEMPEDHANKILRNTNFHVSDKPVKKERKASQIKPKYEPTYTSFEFLHFFFVILNLYFDN